MPVDSAGSLAPTRLRTGVVSYAARACRAMPAAALVEVRPELSDTRLLALPAGSPVVIQARAAGRARTHTQAQRAHTHTQSHRRARRGARHGRRRHRRRRRVVFGVVCAAGAAGSLSSPLCDPPAQPDRLGPNRVAV